MKKQKFLLIIYFLVATFAFSSCRKEAAENSQSIIKTTPTDSPDANLSPTPLPKAVSSIKEVDFKNFTYSWTEEQELDEKLFTLKDGKKEMTDESNGATFEKVTYGDVTKNGAEEAMVSIAPETGGNCSCNMVFIYTIENKQPKLLWSFDTWDRAEGGLKKVYADKGDLIIETFGDNKFENDKWEFKFPKKITGYCCPTAYTKIRFRWNGSKFVVEGKPELFDYDFKKEQEKIQDSH